MKTTVKQFNFKLSKEELKSLDYLSEKLGEKPSQVLRRSLIMLYMHTRKPIYGQCPHE